MPTVSALFIHPLKSAAAVSVERAEVEPRGLAGDRTWLAATPQGDAITQRQRPRLALVSATLTGSALRLSAPGREPLVVPAPDATGPASGAAPSAQATAADPRAATDRAAPHLAASHRTAPSLAVRVWAQDCDALDAGDAAARWLSAYLGQAARLVRMAPAAPRRVQVDHDPRTWDVSFADELPLLIATEASLAELNRRLRAAVSMRRFRPNIVVRGGAPFEEDRWARIAIGDVELELLKPCARCGVITIDQESGEADPKGEPFRTLARFRRTTSGEYADKPERAYFGWRAVSLGAGTIRVGDEVRVLASRPAASA